MNDPSAQPIDIEEMRNWLIDYRTKTQASWSDLSSRIDIPTGTLSQFGSPRGYAGNEQKLAETIFKFRQTISTQAQIAVEAPEVPDFYSTPTSSQLEAVLKWAQRGRITLAAMGPGLGKTKTAARFSACYSNVFLATMTPSTAGVNNMQQEVLMSLGERDPVGTPQKLSRQIRDRVKNLENPLLIIDEAQHLSEKAVEEIRSWNDAVGLGIALFGNLSVIQRLEGGSRRAAFAQLYSRVSFRVVRQQPLQGDIDAMADAWGVFEPAERQYLTTIAMLPGGLRGATMALELATMIASTEQRALAKSDLQDAWAQLSARPVAA